MTPKSSPSKGIFGLYQSVVIALGENEKAVRKICYACFEVKLLELTGQGLLLDREADHETEISAGCCFIVMMWDRARCRSGRLIMHGTLYRETTLIALQTPLTMKSEHVGATKKFMRGVIDIHLGNRSLRSREILQFIA